MGSSILKSSEIIGTIEFDLPARGDMGARQVKQTVQVARIKLASPTSKSNRTRGYLAIEVTAILTSEIFPPEGVEPAEWLLLSSIDVGTKETAIELIS